MRRLALLLAMFFGVAVGRAGSLPFTFTKVGPEYRLTLQPDATLYFGFQHTDDLLQTFDNVEMALGVVRAGGTVGRVGAAQYEQIPFGFGPLMRNITVTGGDNNCVGGVCP